MVTYKILVVFKDGSYDFFRSIQVDNYNELAYFTYVDNDNDRQDAVIDVNRIQSIQFVKD